MSVKFCIHTLGCRVNQYESDAIAANLEAAGWIPCKPNEGPDVAIVHTCAVTQEATRKSGQMIRRMKQRFQAKLVVALGCQVELLDGSSEADLALGNRKKNLAHEAILEAYEAYQEGRLVTESDQLFAFSDEARPSEAVDTSRAKELLQANDRKLQHATAQPQHRTSESRPTAGQLPNATSAGQASRPRMVLGGIRQESLICHQMNDRTEDKRGQRIFAETGAVTEQQGTRAYIKVQDGCDMRCTYCAIHTARGASCSRSFEAVLEEARALLRRGYRELVLTGIEVAAYGYDLDEKKRLIDLLEAIDSMPGLDRLLTASLDPRIASEDFASRVSKLQHFGAHFHLSLQSGATSVLRRMKRPYTAEAYQKACDRLKRHLPDVNLTTDLIVGFPGETEEEHAASLAFVRGIGFSDLHIFPYSDRPGTEASQMPQKVAPDQIKKRMKDFQKLRQELWKQRASEEFHREHDVLVEQIEAREALGYSRNYLPMRVSGAIQNVQVGQVLHCQVIGSDDKALLAIAKA